MAARSTRGPLGLVTAAVAALVMALVLGLAGCTTTDQASRTPASPQDTAATTPEATPDGLSPFTGLPGRLGPVLAVKIDNVRPARPHTGLEAADLVYVEQVEGGLTRLLAVYASQDPPRVGPVRSARESDVELLRQFGRPALAYSGVQSALKPLIEDAPLFPLPPEEAPAAYVRDPSRPAPHNLYVVPEKALAAAPGADLPQDIGFRFGAAPEGGRPTESYAVGFPAARYGFAWSAAEKRWLVSMDGTAARTTGGERVGAPTVVVQHVTVRPSDYQDRGGNVTPYTETVGSGSAVVLRDGKSYDARWSRPSATDGTTFTGDSGEPLPFAPGPVWIVLAPR